MVSMYSGWSADEGHANLFNNRDSSVVFTSRDIRWLNAKSPNGAKYSFIGGCAAMCSLWLSNVAEGLPMKMTQPDHIIATLVQLKYMAANESERINGLLSAVGLEGHQAMVDVDGESLLNAIRSTGDNMFLLKTSPRDDGPFVIPHVLAFVRRGGDTFFFDPRHGLFQYGGDQHAQLRERFYAYAYDEELFTYWTVRAAPDRQDDAVNAKLEAA